MRTVIATAREIIVDCTCYDLFSISFEHIAESVGSMTDRDRSRSREHPFSRSHGVASNSSGPNESSEATRGLNPIPINAVSGPVRLVGFQSAHDRSRVLVEVGSTRLRISAERESIVIHIEYALDGGIFRGRFNVTLDNRGAAIPEVHSRIFPSA